MTTRSAPAAPLADRLVGAATAVAGVVYSVFLLTPLWGTALDPARSYVSELAALDQPLGALFRGIDMAVGLVVAVAGVRLAHRADARAVRAAGVALALFGTATLVDALAPMACAPSVDPVCAAQELDRTVLEFGAHEVASVAADLTAIVALVLLLVARSRRRTADQQAGVVQTALLVGLPHFVVPGLLVVVEETVGLGLDPWVGYLQRLQVLALSGVLVTIGLVTVGGSRWTRR